MRTPPSARTTQEISRAEGSMSTLQCMCRDGLLHVAVQKWRRLTLLRIACRSKGCWAAGVCIAPPRRPGVLHSPWGATCMGCWLSLP